MRIPASRSREQSSRHICGDYVLFMRETYAFALGYKPMKGASRAGACYRLTVAASTIASARNATFAKSEVALNITLPLASST